MPAKKPKTPLQIAEERIEEARRTLAERLDISELRLTSLPPSIGRLKSLKVLIANSNRFVGLPDSIGELRDLQRLYLGANKLTSLPDAICQLQKLERLSLGTNSLTVLPASIGELGKLKMLLLAQNCLTVLPRTIQDLRQLNELYLHDNPDLHLPAEVLGPTWIDVHQGKKLKPASPASMLSFYFERERRAQPLNEVKLVLVGRGGAGKTSIARRLIENKFNARQAETPGIAIKPWEVRCGGQNVRVHVWDFAGQVVTHATHQFFLTHRSVYVLVLTGRENSERDDAEYWLRLIRAFGTDRQTGQMSPVVIALNKCKSSPCHLDRNALREKYPFIVEFVETDCQPANGFGIAAMKQQITSTIAGLDTVRDQFPSAWFSIKERLSKMPEDHLSYAKYQELCTELGEPDIVQQRNLSVILHVLGLALNYADDERLRDTTVLNPQWVTNGIYRVLREAANDKGELRLTDVARLLPDEKPAMRRYLVELMRRFELAFPVADDGSRWLVPQRLPDTQPQLDAEWQGPDVTRLRYKYAALPEGLLPRFITRTYPLSEGLPRWINGVMLQLDEARALVRADRNERLVTVAVLGPKAARRGLTGLIKGDLQRIHADIRGLDPVAEIELAHRPGVYVPVQTLEADERENRPSAAATGEGTVQVSPARELDRMSKAAARDPDVWKARLFICYSSHNARLRDELVIRLKPLDAEGLVEFWHDRCLVAGDDWDKKIRDELKSADVIVFLMSPHFEATDYIQDVEVDLACRRADDGDAILVPIILEKCGWKHGRLSKYSVLPEKGAPIRDGRRRADGWYEVYEALRDLLIRLQRRKRKSRVPAVSASLR